MLSRTILVFCGKYVIKSLCKCKCKCFMTVWNIYCNITHASVLYVNIPLNFLTWIFINQSFIISKVQISTFSENKVWSIFTIDLYDIKQHSKVKNNKTKELKMEAFHDFSLTLSTSKAKSKRKERESKKCFVKKI